MKILLGVLAVLALGTVLTLPLKQTKEQPKDLSSLLGTTNILGSLAHLTQGTDLATVLNILNFLNSLNQLSVDIHNIPAVLNMTVSALGAGVGNITLTILNELSGKRDLSSLLGTSNLLGSLAHLTQGTDLATVLNILNFLNSLHQLSVDLHNIPAVLNMTVSALGAGVGNITLAILNELSGKRDLSSLLGNTNILGSLAHLSQGTDLATVLNILNFLNSLHQLSVDLHNIPAVLNMTVSALGEGVGNITLAILNELSGKRDLSSLLGTTNILGSLAHLTQGTDLATVLNILNFLNSLNQLSVDIHNIPAVLNMTVSALGAGVGNITLTILNELSGKRDLSSLLGTTNILGSLAHLSQGTDLATVLNILNFLNSLHQLSVDIHNIPTVLNMTVSALGEGVGNITLAILNELSGKRDLSSLLGTTNLLGSLAHLSQGTDLATVLNILNFLNSLHQLSVDIHNIPTVLNMTVSALGEGVGNITLAILNELSG